MQTKKHSHFLRLLDEEVIEREREVDECQRKLAILRDLRQNYISASARKGYQPSYRLTSNWRTAIEAALAFLREQAGPVSTVCILDHLNNVGTVLGGHQPRNSLSVMLSRSPLFKADGRRGWTLAELARSPPSPSIKQKHSSRHRLPRAIGLQSIADCNDPSALRTVLANVRLIP